MSKDTLLLLIGLLEGLFWILAYLFIVRRSFKDKTYGMPVIAMCGNIGWEIIYGLNLYPVCPISWPNCPQTLFQVRDFAAMFIDGLILYTILRFGAAQFKAFPAVQKYWTPLVIFGVVVGFGLVYLIEGTFFVPNVNQIVVDGSVPDYLPIALQSGLYTGFALELDMDILFVAMLLVRGNLAGQSFWIAVTKMIGTIFAYLFVVVLGDQTPLVNLLMGASMIFDFTYVVLVYRKCKELGINPWRNA
jgi:hypothetical protein